jgi:membrane fusion protein
MPEVQEHQNTASEPLFRPEVLAERQTQWLGTVLLTPKILHGMFTAFGCLTAAAILCLLIFGDYTRKAHINGWLMPQEGLIRLFTPQPGVVTRLYVQEGEDAREGAPILELSTEA